MSNPDSASSSAENQAEKNGADDLMARVEDFDFEFNEDFEGEIENEYKAILDWQFDNNTQGVSQPYEDEDEDGPACEAGDKGKKKD